MKWYKFRYFIILFYFISFCFSHIFSELSLAKESAVSTNMTIRNGPIHTQTTPFVLPQRYDNSIQTQRNSLSDASVGEYALASSVLDQNTIHHGNTDVNDNDD